MENKENKDTEEKKEQHEQDDLNDMRIEANRLRTFETWKSLCINPERLSRAGFYLSNRTSQTVKCFCCGGELSEWTLGMSAIGKHRQLFPHCPFVKGIDNLNIPLSRTNSSASTNSMNNTNMSTNSSVKFNHLTSKTSITATPTTPTTPNTPNTPFSPTIPLNSPDSVKSPTYYDKNEASKIISTRFPVYSSMENRLKSFESVTWPRETITQTPQQFAEAGFFYTGNDDKVQCFCCSGILHEWCPGDDPAIDHAKYYPDCVYIEKLKGIDFIKDIKENYPISYMDFVCVSKKIDAEDYFGFESLTENINGSTIKPNQESNVSENQLDKTENQLNKSTLSESVLPPNQSVLDTKNDDQLCIICLEKEKCVAFIPCGHINCCVDCSRQFFNRNECPTCRTKIISTFRVYW